MTNYPFLSEIHFKKTHPEALLPRRNNSNDTGYDLFAVEDVTIPSKGDGVVPTGIQVAKVPENIWYLILPRSGMGFKHGIQPHLGVIDNCVPAGTKILTSEGEINVEDLFEREIKPNIISYHIDSHQLQEDNIKDMWIVENRELFKIHTADGNILEVPPEKELYTKKGWIKALNLTEGDEILSVS